MKMFVWRQLVYVAILTAWAGVACGELQNVQVGGEIRIRGRYWEGGWAGAPIQPIPAQWARGRSLGPFGLTSMYNWDNRRYITQQIAPGVWRRSKVDTGRAYVEQRTALHVKADFTQNVSAYVDIHDFTIWGEDFRSDYVTGADRRANTSNDVEIYQGYIEADQIFGVPLRLRLGRQELVMGKGWLVGNMISPVLGMSFDAARLTYTHDMFSVDAFAAKLVETMAWDDDVNLFGVYAAYTDFAPLQVAGYYFWVRDARKIDDSPNSSPILNWVEDILGYNNYNDTHLHTVGLRLNGKHWGFDYDAEVAYQFGEADQVGALFRRFPGGYGDQHARWDNWATDVEVGYTVDVKCKPRFFIGGAYYQGDDNRDMSFFDWINPFNTKGKASVSFNRLFSNLWYSSIFDILGGASALTNFYQVRGGATVNITDSVSTGLRVAQYWIDATFDLPVTWGNIPIASVFPFMTKPAKNDLGTVATLWLKYNYTEDIFITVGWEHMFTGRGVDGGSYIMKHGLEYAGGTNNRDADYIWFDTGIKF